MGQRLADQTALVTGAASGMGRAIATRFAAEGAAVTVADVRETPRQGGGPTHDLIRSEGGDACFVETDVSDPDAITDAVSETVDRFGSLDVMVNNAGIWGDQSPITEVSEESYDAVIDVNVGGVYFGCQAAIRVMNDQPSGGCVINMSSIAGLSAYENASAYCASKAAVANLTRELAAEQGPNGIRVNAISPGVIETAQLVVDEDAAGEFEDEIPLRREGKPDEVASAALFLASDAGSYVNGHNLVVDGGFTS
ncbi:SDR family NAD(P)-dependent oxidoreductase [Natrarchaeobius sp. A-rgal3]|uniref:SDR family NAD(P)-dependent oxidoreductase n=1 Tax=Natrarchaeobius versutus TaxID=1679078 RepID=UPI0035107CF3